MKIELEVSAGSTKRLLVLGSTAAVLLAGSVVYAEVQAHTEGETLTAQKLNENNADLVKQIAESRVAVAPNGRRYSIGAIFRKETPAVTGKFITGGTGYESAKAQCEQQLAPSKTAHMCTADELVRSRQLGVAIPVDGWYSTGTYATDNSPGQAGMLDCDGWTSSTAPALGPMWQAAASRPVVDGCERTHAVLCCD